MIGHKLVEISEAIAQPPWTAGSIPSIDEELTALQLRGGLSGFFFVKFWDEDDLHEVHCPGREQGAQSHQCVYTWRNKTDPLNCMFIVEEFLVSYYDREINRQIKHWRKNRHWRPKVSEGSPFYLQVLQRLLTRILTERQKFGEGSWFFFNENIPAWRIEVWCSLTHFVHVVCM
jgi:hypothetical protein